MVVYLKRILHSNLNKSTRATAISRNNFFFQKEHRFIRKNEKELIRYTFLKDKPFILRKRAKHVTSYRNPSTCEAEGKDYEFRPSLGCVLSSKSAWDWSQNTKRKRSFEKIKEYNLQTLGTVCHFYEACYPRE